jgi:hypothetical protein
MSTIAGSWMKRAVGAASIVVAGVFVDAIALPARDSSNDALTFVGPTCIAPTKGSFPTVGVDPMTGELLVAWSRAVTDSTYDTMLTVVTADGRTKTALRANTVEGQAVASKEFPPQLVVGAGGVACILWIRSRPLRERDTPELTLCVSRLDGARSVVLPASIVHVPPKGTHAADLYSDIAIGSDGTLFVTWLDLIEFANSTLRQPHSHAAHEATRKTDDRSDYSSLWLARSRDGGSAFEAPLQLDAWACTCCRTAVATGANGVVRVMWRHVFPGNVRDPVVGTSRDGGKTFAKPSRVYADQWVLAGCPDIGPDIAIANGDRVRVGWFSGSSSHEGLFYSGSRDGGATFTAPLRLSSEPTFPSQIKLAAGGADVWAVWEVPAADGAQLRIGRDRADGGLKVVGPEGLTGQCPAIATDGRRVAVVWEQGGAIYAMVARLPG